MVNKSIESQEKDEISSQQSMWNVLSIDMYRGNNVVICWLNINLLATPMSLTQQTDVLVEIRIFLIPADIFNFYSYHSITRRRS